MPHTNAISTSRNSMTSCIFNLLLLLNGIFIYIIVQKPEVEAGSRSRKQKPEVEAGSRSRKQKPEAEAGSRSRK